MAPKEHTSIRLTPAAMELQRKLAVHMGVSKASVLELAIRELAAKHGIEQEPSIQTPDKENK